MKIKICGITNSQDALWAANLGADFIGLNFYSESPRKVSLKHAKEIASQLPPFISTVGLFVNETLPVMSKTIKSVGLKCAQLHGDEAPEICLELRALGVKVIKAFRLKEPLDVASLAPYEANVDFYLFDFYSEGTIGGTGHCIEPAWLTAASALSKPWFLAGGLNPQNVADAIKLLKPPMVDVCSGVERSPTRKNYDAMKAFIQTVRSAK